MDYSTATKEQLLTICLYEDCPLHLKYDALYELAIRGERKLPSWNDSYLTDIIRLWGKGLTAFEISLETGLDITTIQTKLRKYKLKRRQAI